MKTDNAKQKTENEYEKINVKQINMKTDNATQENEYEKINVKK